jgi:hypothetical protein
MFLGKFAFLVRFSRCVETPDIRDRGQSTSTYELQPAHLLLKKASSSYFFAHSIGHSRIKTSLAVQVTLLLV